MTKKHYKKYCFFIFVISFLTYISSLGNEFAFDDNILIVDNPGIFSLKRSLNYFTHAVFPGDLYRPLTMISYAANYFFSGLDPFYYHCINLILHSIVSVCVFLLLVELIDLKIAFLTAIFFAILPIHTEAIANIVGRAEILAAFFVLLSLLFFIKSKEKTFFIFLSGLSLFLGLLSKESAVCGIFLIALIMFFQSLKLKKFKFHCAVLFCFILLWIALRSMALGALIPNASQTAFIDNPLFGLSFFSRLPAAFSILGKYIGLCLLPVRLSADYSYPALFPFKNDIYESSAWFLVNSLALIALFVGLKKKTLPGFFLAWFYFAFVITANIFIPIGTIMGERLAYLPSLGICGLLAWFLLEGLKNHNNHIKGIFIAIICLSFFIISYSWAKVWKNNKTLYSNMIELMPNSAKVQLNYSMLMLEDKSYVEAETHAQKALSLYPQYAHAAWAIGEIWLQQKSFKPAELWFRKAYQLDSNHTDSLLGLGRLALAVGDLKTAEIYFDMVIDKKPSAFEAEVGKLAILVNQKNWEKANQLADKLNKWNPSHKELNKVITTLEKNQAN